MAHLWFYKVGNGVSQRSRESFETSQANSANKRCATLFVKRDADDPSVAIIEITLVGLEGSDLDYTLVSREYSRQKLNPIFTSSI